MASFQDNVSVYSFTQKIFEIICKPGIALSVIVMLPKGSVQFSHSVVWLFVTPWTAARQASLPITNS